MSNHVIETVTFKLNEGISREAFTKAARAMSVWVTKCDGFIARRLSCTEDGTWIEHVEWTDMTSAKAAAADIGKEAGNADFLSAINGSTVNLKHSKLQISVN